jgi:hypothetical protein
MDLQTPIKLDLNLDEVNGIMAALGELPTKTNAFALMAKIRAQAEPQLPKEEPKAEEPKAE